MREILASILSSSQSNREDIEYRFWVEHFGVETDLSLLQQKNPCWRAAGKVLHLRGDALEIKFYQALPIRIS